MSVVQQLWVTLTILQLHYQGTNATEAQVIRDIFRNYVPNARPLYDPNKTLQLDAFFVLLNIQHLMWQDEYLKWNASEYNGTQQIVVDSRKVWLPEVILYNRFPFDTQECEIQFVSILHGGIRYPRMVYFNPYSNDVLLHMYRNNSGWGLVESKVTNDGLFGSHNTFYPTLFIRLKLKRDPTYFVTNMIIPSVFLSILSTFVFLLPPESGEKIALQVTIVLSYLMLLLVVADLTPSTGMKMPLISTYLIACQCMAIACLLVTIFIMNLYHRCGSRPVSPTLKKFITILSFLLCMYKENRTAVAKTTQEYNRSDKVVNLQMNNNRTEETNKDNNSCNDVISGNPWVEVATVLDRFFFVLFLTFTISFTVTTLVTIEKEY